MLDTDQTISLEEAEVAFGALRIGESLARNEGGLGVKEWRRLPLPTLPIDPC